MRIDYNDVYTYLHDLIDNNLCKPFVIALDGRSASGKTSLAQRLKREMNIPVIHTDDFYRPKNQFGELELSEYSGNFDVDRFKSEVVSSIENYRPIKYGVFDCKEGIINRFDTITDYGCVIVEGAYCLHPKLGDYADIKLFFDVEREVQLQRIKARNGESALEKFVGIWIPCEEQYINKFKINETCDIIVYGGQ